MVADVYIGEGGKATLGTVTEEGSGYKVGDTITLKKGDIGGSKDLVLQVSSVEEDSSE
jgi:hypothetical protein